MAQWIVQDQNTWQLSGELDVNSVTTLLKSFSQQTPKPQTVDLSAVTRTDSAGLALLLELKRLTKQSTLDLQNMPQQMSQLAEVNGVAELLA
ncbi:STAS domain-containing protein [Candidatus Albibeggiatoa sp. nov. NOAA]|uniref:STAS domain-containing protein n=1 Tax=Candidatus Albibeggiatoa sp. nov. NOAA TaxID=3162724 RepID=UPI0032F6E9A9|nr:STAS domain-containing protein [Thiotrichaceae bacterium]